MNIQELVRVVGECRELSAGRRLHSLIFGAGYGGNRYLANVLIRMYGESGGVSDAEATFTNMERRNIFSWNILLAAYAHNGHMETAESVLYKMPSWCPVSWNSLLGGYVRGGDARKAKVIFDRMPVVDVYSRTSLMSAFCEEGDLVSAREMFSSMSKRSLVSWTVMLEGVGRHGDLHEAVELFEKLPCRDTVAWNSLLNTYAEKGHLLEAKVVFDRIPSRSIVSWNTIACACARNGEEEEAGMVFVRMPHHNLVSSTAMMAVQGQRGNLPGATSVFNSTREESDVVSWTAMIGTYAQSGCGVSGVEMFRCMLLHGVTPNAVTFTTVLSVCSRAGMMSTGRELFMSMQQDHGMEASCDHYECVIDLLGRIGELERAELLINAMPSQPEPLTWMTLLSACNVHRGEAGSIAPKVVQLHPEDGAPYILLSNIYSYSAGDICTVNSD